MKKKFISAFLVLTMLLSLTGCGSDQKALVGRWEADIDCTQALEAEIGAALEEEMLPYFHLSSFTMKLVLTFREDGTYSMAVDEERMQDTAAVFRKDLSDTMEAYMKDVVAAEGIEWEAFLNMLGGTMEELMNEILPDSDMNEMVQDVVEGVYRSGRYLAKGGKLYLTNSASESIEDSMYDEYVLKDDTLTLITSTEEMDAFESSLYPMTFRKAG